MSLLIRPIDHASADYAASVNLRRALLRTPLGLDFTSAQLATEASDTHLAAFEDDELIGIVVLSPYDTTTLKLRQMAVDDSARGAGTGAKLLAAAEDFARTQGKQTLILTARLTARDFYARNGYTAEGEVFEEVTLPHILMHKTL